MSISQEWTKAIRDTQGVMNAIRTSLGSAWPRKSGKRSKARASQVATTRSIVIVDRRVSAELEQRKSLALLDRTRSWVK